MRYMITYRSALAFLLVLVFSSSCEQLSELSEADLPEFVDQLVVNADLDNTNNVSLEVSTTTWAYEAGTPEVIGDVTLVFTQEGIEIPLTLNSGRFSSPVKPKSGEVFTVAVFKDNYRTISANCRIPEQVLNKTSGYVSGGGTDLQGRVGDEVFIEFDDPSGEDFYEIKFFYYSELANEFILFDFEVDDLTLRSPNTLKLNNGGFLFSDELFDGSRKRFSAIATAALTSANSDIKYLVQLKKVSKDYWKYWRTLQQFRDQQEGNGSGPFGNAVILHSNVSGGLGVMMSSYVESDTIR